MHLERLPAAALALVAGFGLLVVPDVAGAQTAKLYTGSLSIHYFAIDGGGPGGSDIFTARPLGAFCNPAVSGGTTCDPSATLQVGAPLTGAGTASVTGSSPASIVLPPLQLDRITSGSLPLRYGGTGYVDTHASIANATGALKAGGGPGYSVWSLPPSLSFGGTSVVISPGKNQFGGVMRLLKGAPSGGLGSRGIYSDPSPPYPFFLEFSVPTRGVTLLGGRTSQGLALPTTDTLTSISYYKGVGYPGTTFINEFFVLGWPWTTGTVTVAAFGDSLYHSPLWGTELRRSGYDNRTPHGAGTIQLVAPHLAIWRSILRREGEVGVLRLQFAPEPGSPLLLLAGASLLVVLYRWRAR
jgi:hypothetical protein